jgi:osmotically-inducible protein OsmY
MKKNDDLQKDVQDAIKWEPLLSASEIGVTAKDGVVTLTGEVDSYRKKQEAENAAKNVEGVKAVVEKIEIRIGTFNKVNDNDIAEEVLRALKFRWDVPNDKVKVEVENGWVTLNGQLEYNYQKEAASAAVLNLEGVREITNNITIKSRNLDQIEKKDIERAFVRNWSVESQDIKVNVSGNKVTLNGTVHSFYQKDEAGRIAWNAPGVCDVDNELIIEYN